MKATSSFPDIYTLIVLSHQVFVSGAPRGLFWLLKGHVIWGAVDANFIENIYFTKLLFLTEIQDYSHLVDFWYTLLSKGEGYMEILQNLEDSLYLVEFF